MKPDMIIKKGKKSSVIIDAKYKHNITDEDLNQIWIYSLVHLLPVSILVYPMFGITQNETRTLVGQGVDALIRSIDLNNKSYEEFEQECDRFVNDIATIILNQI